MFRAIACNIKHTVVNKDSGDMSESCPQDLKDAMFSTDNRYGYISYLYQINNFSYLSGLGLV